MSTIKAQFDLQTRLYNNVLEGINDVESNERASQTVNHIKWLAGHLLTTRQGLSQFGGLPEDTSLDEFFGHGNGIDESKNYPPLELIRKRWNEISDKISQGLGRLTPAALSGQSPAKTPIGDDTLEGFLGFLMHHEAYHIGQIGILRKYLGKAPMSYQ